MKLVYNTLMHFPNMVFICESHDGEMSTFVICNNHMLLIMEQQLVKSNILQKCKIHERKIKICLQCGSGNMCVNQHGMHCKSCGFLRCFE